MKTIIIKTAVVLALLSGAIDGGSPGKLFAASSMVDSKAIPAALCQTNPGGKGIAMYGYNGEVYNRHPSEPLAVICPLLRDVMNQTRGLYHIQVSFAESHPTLHPTCSLYYYDAVKETRQSLKLRKKPNQNILASLPAYYGKKVGKGLTAYSVECSLPPKRNGKVSRLISVGYDEYK